MDKNIMMAIGAAVIIAIVVMVLGQPSAITEEREAELNPSVQAPEFTEGVPDITIQECLTQIKATNPEMTDQQANDNCYTIEAVNQNDPSLCEQVSEGLRQNCLDQF